MGEVEGDKQQSGAQERSSPFIAVHTRGRSGLRPIIPLKLNVSASLSRHTIRAKNPETLHAGYGEGSASAVSGLSGMGQKCCGSDKHTFADVQTLNKQSSQTRRLFPRGLLVFLLGAPPLCLFRLYAAAPELLARFLLR